MCDTGAALEHSGKAAGTLVWIFNAFLKKKKKKGQVSL